MSNTKKKKRAVRVFYKNFSKQALDALVSAHAKDKHIKKVRAAVYRYPEFRSLSDAQIRRLISMHKINHVSTNGNPFNHTEDPELMALKIIGQMADALDPTAFERVLNYGLHLTSNAK